MDGIHPHFAMKASFSFLLLILLQTSTEAQICSAPGSVEFQENNTVNAVVTKITVQPGVTMTFKPAPANPDNPFKLEADSLIATTVLDREKTKTHAVEIICKRTDNLTSDLIIIVSVTDVNDNPPVFANSTYTVSVDEMSPKGTSVGDFPATDLDKGRLYYRLIPESSLFKLDSATNPELQIETPLEYDKVKSVKLILYAQDTPLTLGSASLSHTASTTIIVNIVDVDNRPPWFLPCTLDDSAGPVVCQSSGYTTRVVLNEQEAGVLPLKPGPLYAIDGDSGLNEEITYSFLYGDAGGLFKINSNTGNITMQKPANILGTITLTVLASQKTNIHQFSTTTVSVSVQEKSDYLPKFEKSQYEGVVTGVGSMATDPNKGEPLIIRATDDDYAATGGLNPHMTYTVKDSSDFSIVDGYLFMTKDLPEGTLSLQVVATDKSNDETATTQLLVERKLGLSTTTSVPLSTTDSMSTTSIGESTTEDILSTSSPGSISTTIPSATSDSTGASTSAGTGASTGASTVSTTNPSLTSDGSLTTSTAHPHTAIVPSGGFGPVDMAALGATLGVLLFICLVTIGVLVCRIRRGDSDWRKIYETSMFRSSLGQGSGGQKEGIQYTNEAFQNDDDDGDSTFSGSPEKDSVIADKEPQNAAGSTPHYETIVTSLAPLHDLLDDDISQAGSEKADSDKEVKPILTKERRMDEGYKSVWFKEDIDPNAKEEVVIIPDSRDNDSEEEDEEQLSSSREDDEDDNPQTKPRRVGFNDADLDSGLGEKMGDPAEDSEDDEDLTADL